VLKVGRLSARGAEERNCNAAQLVICFAEEWVFSICLVKREGLLLWGRLIS